MKSANEKWMLTKAELMRTSVCLCDLQAHSLWLPFGCYLAHISSCPLCQKYTSQMSQHVSSREMKSNIRSEKGKHVISEACVSSEGSGGLRWTMRTPLKKTAFRRSKRRLPPPSTRGGRLQRSRTLRWREHFVCLSFISWPLGKVTEVRSSSFCSFEYVAFKDH